MTSSLDRVPSREAGREWVCFHCDEVFTEEAAAREHFGSDELSGPGCVEKLKAGDKLLLGTIRDLEERNRELLRRAQEAEYDAEGHASLRAELQRYFGHRDAWSCWNTISDRDYAQGLKDGRSLSSPERGDR